jgi:transcriptional regulator with XRE-family HTH domain
MQALLNLQHIASETGLGSSAGMDIYETRRTRVTLLIKRLGLNYSQFGDRVEVAPQTVSRWFRDDKHAKNIGEKVARRIEELCDLPRGWLDGVDTVAEVAATYNAEPMRLETLLSLLAVQLDTATAANRPLIADLMQRFVLDPAARDGAVAAIRSLVPVPSPDERVARSFGTPRKADNHH